ncbi:F0F1 ATP synthase alpha subunit [Corchorus olitorius]|uniref:F0F1 ATP synthase alpha subunit n=1 Tax=Corchorus olitorius TaxID=93759 RepID=A0A1R3L2Q8_9ROSI|nr:F0F1 ATP synthase alpha subunit [Corchorus olitorius]
MLTAGLLVLGGETVGELRAVVGEDLADLDGRSQLQATQEIDAAFLCHVAVDVHEDPARSTVDGNEQVAARGLVRHLRQILDVDVNEAWLIVLEGLFRRDCFALGLRNHIFQTRHAFALEETGDAGTRYVGIDVLLGDEQQIVEGQVERLAQCQDDGFLGRAQSRVQRVRTVGAVLHIIASKPLLGRRTRDVENLGSLSGRETGVFDLLADFRGGTGLRVNA